MGTMTRALLALLLILSVVAAAAADDAAAAKRRLRRVAKTDVAAQAGDGRVSADGAAITAAADPFAFQKVGRLRELRRVTIRLTIDDGDTGPGDGDEGDLVLALDGVDTGIALDGFDDDDTDTRTISGTPANAGRILAALQDDGELAASIIDWTPGDNNLSVPADFEATLTLEGKQEVRVARDGRR